MNILSTVAKIGDKAVNMKRSWKESNAMQESSGWGVRPVYTSDTNFSSLAHLIFPISAAVLPILLFPATGVQSPFLREMPSSITFKFLNILWTKFNLKCFLPLVAFSSNGSLLLFFFFFSASGTNCFLLASGMKFYSQWLFLTTLTKGSSFFSLYYPISYYVIFYAITGVHFLFNFLFVSFGRLC